MNKPTTGIFSSLSLREWQVLISMLNGLSIKEIAYQLKLKSNTISTYKKNIYYKLRIRTQIELFQLLLKEKLLKK